MTGASSRPALALAVTLVATLVTSPLHAQENPIRRAPTDAELAKRALVTVDATFQDWEWNEPWRKRQPGTRSGSALVLGDGRVLTTAGVVSGATLLELRRGSEQTPWRAKVVLVDHLANLALLAPEDAAFFAGLAPLAWAESLPAAADQAKVSIHRFRQNRRLDSAAGTVTEVDATEPGAGTAQLLTGSATVQMEGGGQSELVMLGGQALGLAHSRWGEKLSFLPAPLIRAWLDDVKRGPERRGFAAAGWRWQVLTNPELRAHLGVPKGREGILLSRVWPYGTGAGVLEDGDVLLKLAGREIDARGNFVHPVYGPVRYGLLLGEGRLAGDVLDAEIVRAGQLRTVKVTLAPDAPNRRVVPMSLPDRQPRYVVHSGLVLTELSMPYLRAFNENAPLRLSIQADLDGPSAPKDRARYVVLTQVLPDAATLGYESVRQKLVATINGARVGSLEEAARALDAPQDGYHVVTFLESPDRVVLDARQAAEAHPRILKAYQIQPERNLATSW
jgi:S1-C subfamily serine protease